MLDYKWEQPMTIQHSDVPYTMYILRLKDNLNSSQLVCRKQFNMACIWSCEYVKNANMGQQKKNKKLSSSIMHLAERHYTTRLILSGDIFLVNDRKYASRVQSNILTVWEANFFSMFHSFLNACNNTVLMCRQCSTMNNENN